MNCLSLTPLLLLAALSSAAPYEVESSSPAPASSAPEKLVEAARSVHCRVEYATIWDTKYEEQPFEVFRRCGLIQTDNEHMNYRCVRQSTNNCVK